MNNLVLLALTIGAVAGCKDESKEAAKQGVASSKRLEAKLLLEKIEHKAKLAVLESGTFPKGKAGPTPSESCCKSPGGKCGPVPAETWSADPIWHALGFQVFESSWFQYAYESDGTMLTATATGDLDCDGTAIVYKLEMGRSPDGNVKSNVTEPPLTAD